MPSALSGKASVLCFCKVLNYSPTVTQRGILHFIAYDTKVEQQNGIYELYIDIYPSSPAVYKYQSNGWVKVSNNINYSYGAGDTSSENPTLQVGWNRVAYLGSVYTIDCLFIIKRSYSNGIPTAQTFHISSSYRDSSHCVIDLLANTSITSTGSTARDSVRKVRVIYSSNGGVYLDVYIEGLVINNGNTYNFRIIPLYPESYSYILSTFLAQSDTLPEGETLMKQRNIPLDRAYSINDEINLILSTDRINRNISKIHMYYNIGAYNYINWEANNEVPVFYMISYPHVSQNRLYTGIVDEDAAKIPIYETTPVNITFSSVISGGKKYVQIYVAFQYATLFLFSSKSLEVNFSTTPLTPDPDT